MSSSPGTIQVILRKGGLLFIVHRPQDHVTTWGGGTPKVGLPDQVEVGVVQEHGSLSALGTEPGRCGRAELVGGRQACISEGLRIRLHLCQLGCLEHPANSGGEVSRPLRMSSPFAALALW